MKLPNRHLVPFAFIIMIISLTTALHAQARSGLSAMLTDSFAPIVKETAPSVVNVYATRIVTKKVSPFQNDPFFERFFGNRSLGVPRQREARSLGSGVVIDEEGLIVTNHHVIDGAQKIWVATSDKREFPAEIILSDERADLAVLKIDNQKARLKAMRLASNDELEVGDIVLAIGNPFGVGQTVTSGIVSALARNNVGIGDYQFFIQTDAAINPGNSGGALINIDGELVGINTAIFTRSGGSNGIGFAIPINMVQVVVDASYKGDHVERPWFGAAMSSINSDMARALGMFRPTGVLITEVYEGSAAHQAGIRPNDIILEVNGEEIQSPDGFGFIYGTLGVEGNAEILIQRGRRQAFFTVDLRPAANNPAGNEVLIVGESPISGTVITNLSPALAIEMRLDPNQKGAVILNVKNRGKAARSGFKKGDIILGINGTQIRNAKDVERAANERRRLWRFTIQRGNSITSMIISG